MIVFISASINQCVDRHDLRSAANRFPAANRTSAASIEKPIHNVKHQPATKLQELFRFIRNKKDGGAYRDRTDDLKLAKLALSQLS